MLSKLFPAPEIRGLVLGLDATGKTTILYKLKLGEVVTTIPTIGFNVETVDIHKAQLTLWDVGGCDRIRPLWRHYYQNTQCIIFVIDGSDKERFHRRGEEDKYYTVEGLFHSTLAEEELKDAPVLVFVNKSDLPGTMTVEQVRRELKIDTMYAGRPMHVHGCSAATGDGLYEGLRWLSDLLLHPPAPPRSLPAPAPVGEAVVSPPPVKGPESPLEEWLSRVDNEDDAFIAQLVDLSLTCWDHYTHLRIAYVLLTKHGRATAMPMLFGHLRRFIEEAPYLNLPGSKQSTFHETMTYFWMHMVHYAMVSTKLPEESFHVFLLMNPQLANSGLFLFYYSKQLMLLNPAARKEVVLPDIKPLPSIVVGASKPSPQVSQTLSVAVKRSDEQFYWTFKDGNWASWGHLPKLRLIYCMLVAVTGRRRGGTDAILAMLERIEGNEHVNTTANYFWIHMVTCAILQAGGADGKFGKIASTAASEDEEWTEQLESFADFIQRGHCIPLQDADLIDK